MAYDIRIHDTALEDIDAAASWIAEKASERKASEWIDSLFETIDTLAEIPRRCPLSPENGKWGPEELRQLLFQDYPSQYRILFHISNQIVHILQVRHGARRYLHEDESLE